MPPVSLSLYPSIPPSLCLSISLAALIFALEQALTYQPLPREVRVFSDSRLVVEQMSGWISVHSAALRDLHRRARALADRFEQVTYTHIPRERNQLADAIADEAING